MNYKRGSAKPFKLDRWGSPHPPDEGRGFKRTKRIKYCNVTKGMHDMVEHKRYSSFLFNQTYVEMRCTKCGKKDFARLTTT